MDLETILTAVTLVVTVAIWLFDRYYVRRRRLSYRVHWDSQVLTSPIDKNMKIDLDILHRSQSVPEASFVMLRIQNVGSLDIDTQDIRRPISFEFPGRTIRHFEIDAQELARGDAERLMKWQNDTLVPDGTATTLPMPTSTGSAPTVSMPVSSASLGEVLTLPAFPIRRKKSIKLLLLLSGPGTGVDADADLSGGTILPERRRSSRTQLGLGLGALSLVLAGLLVGLILTNGSGDPAAVAGGGLPTISCPAKLCVDHRIHDHVPGDLHDLQAVPQAVPGRVDHGGAGHVGERAAVPAAGPRAGRPDRYSRHARIGLAMVDQYAHAPVTPETAGLEYWSVGVTPFVVVVNKSANVSQLTTDQLRQLYSGKVARWNSADLGGADEPVVLISRSDGSGTRETFEQRVLESKESALTSSSDCISPNLDATAPVLHCEIKTQKTLIDRVTSIDGAVGT